MSEFRTPYCGRTLAGIAAAITSLVACDANPTYVDPETYVEVGIPDSNVTVATTQVILPIRLETQDENMARTALSNELGGIAVPYVQLDDLSVSMEWTIRNLTDSDGTARILVNGGNEYFLYVPANFVVDPEEDEEPPSLLGGIPRTVPALGTISGVFREDEIREAALDWELISRGGFNPFAAIFEQHNDVTELTDAMTGATVPQRAFAHLIQYDVSLQSNRHMVLEFTLRVRDERDLLHDFLLDANQGELTGFMPIEFAPMPPMPAP